MRAPEWHRRWVRHRHVTVVQGSLAKGYGTLGGFIVGPASVVDSVRSHASGFIFTTSLPPAIAAAGARERAPLRGSDGERDSARTQRATLREAFARPRVDADAERQPHPPGARAGRRALPRGRAASAERSTRSTSSRSTTRPSRAEPSGCVSPPRPPTPRPTPRRSQAPSPSSYGSLTPAARTAMATPTAMAM